MVTTVFIQNRKVKQARLKSKQTIVGIDVTGLAVGALVVGEAVGISTGVVVGVVAVGALVDGLFIVGISEGATVGHSEGVSVGLELGVTVGLEVGTSEVGK